VTGAAQYSGQFDAQPAGAVDCIVVDTVDRALLEALRANARATYAELGRLVGLSAPSVHERVGKLEASGVVRGYHAAVAPEALGYAVSALMSIFTTETANAGFVSVALGAVPEIEDCWSVAGEEAYIIKVRVQNTLALEELINEINRIKGVSRTRTTVVLSTKFEGRMLTPESD
jgi:Lrp/AsnC family leucine-responsive transcriptional regulator